MALGEELRDARLQRKLTASQVAAATRMKVQIVEALEAEDFSKIAAPIYGKGFIRLYADYVGLDPQPLLDEYLIKIGAPIARSEAAARAEEDVAAAQAEAAAPAAANEPDLFSHLDETTQAAEPEAPAEDVVPRAPLVDAEAVRRAAARTWNRVREGGVRMWTRTRGAAVALRSRLGQAELPQLSLRFRFSGSPLKTVSVTVAVLLVLVFVISCLSRCGRQPGEFAPAPGAAAGTDSGMRLALEPPDPQVDAPR